MLMFRYISQPNSTILIMLGRHLVQRHSIEPLRMTMSCSTYAVITGNSRLNKSRYTENLAANTDFYNLCTQKRLYHSNDAFNKQKSSSTTTKTEDKPSNNRDNVKILQEELFGESSKLGLFAKFKLMYKKYWYVLIPVHLVTSIGWFGGFYYMSQSGVDIAAILQYLNVSETIIDKMHKSSMGHLAVAYLCYKIATPLRYGVTLGGTTIAIKHLVQSGYIKPVPSKNEMMDFIEQKKSNLTNAKDEWVQKQKERNRPKDE